MDTLENKESGSYKIRPAGRHLLTIGRDLIQDNNAALIELIKNDDIIFVFIGEGKERVSLENYVKENGIINTYFLGLIPKTSVRSWLQNAYAAFVTFKNIPVLQTSSPNKMFDAFAAGVPIIQSTQGWIKELVKNENCGISVDPQKATEM